MNIKKYIFSNQDNKKPNAIGPKSSNARLKTMQPSSGNFYQNLKKLPRHYNSRQNFTLCESCLLEDSFKLRVHQARNLNIKRYKIFKICHMVFTFYHTPKRPLDIN